MRQEICALCGTRNANTREHIPPRGIFPNPRPSDLITVPACYECNNNSSRLDESFLVHLGMHVGSDEGVYRRVLEDRALPALKHNTRLRNWIVSRMRPANILGPDNNVIGEVSLGLWDSEAHSAVIEKCIRGLHYHHYGEILMENTKVKTYYFHNLSPEILRESMNWASNSVGAGQFVYKYTSASNDSASMSLWILQFFDRHWAGGQTLTKLDGAQATRTDPERL